ncbi:hypothetical protein HDU85_004859 [Gaertneriomyces sp. JEL0708]|nr:hypothetical protein HDU85_004859 [Gaertneriomyces sp. JEL0708]
MRRISEDRQRLREDNQRLEKLISEKNLAEREELTKKVEELVLKVHEHEKKTLDALRKADLTEKNLNVDNRGLRVRVHVLEQENYELTQQVAKLNQLIKDREKHIASLEIYRYTAVHRKPDPTPTVCKACQERGVNDEQQQVRDTISSRLPRLRPPRLSLTISRDVTVSITAPPFLVCNEDGSIKTQYDRLLLRYSEDWGMLDGVRETVVAVAPDQHDTRRGDDAGAESRTNVNDEKHPHDLQEVEPTRKSDSGTKPVTPEQCDRFIKDLLPDRTYFFQVLCAYLDISGPASPIASIYIERPKTAARHTEVKTEIAGPEIVPRKPYKPRLIKSESGFEILAPLTAGSSTSRIYCDKHVVNALGESQIDTVMHSDVAVDLSADEGWFSYIWKTDDLEPGTTYSFRIQNGNIVGWGDVSDESEPVQIEEQPSPEISEPEPTHFVAEQQQEIRTRSPSPEPQPLQASQKTASQLTLNQKIQNMYHGLPANYEPTK